MNTTNKAKLYTRGLIDAIDISKWTYHGVLDVTEHIDFQDIAGNFGLSNEEYEDLIDYAQNYGELRLKTISKTRILKTLDDILGMVETREGDVDYKSREFIASEICGLWNEIDEKTLRGGE